MPTDTPIGQMKVMDDFLWDSFGESAGAGACSTTTTLYRGPQLEYTFTGDTGATGTLTATVPEGVFVLTNDGTDDDVAMFAGTGVRWRTQDGSLKVRIRAKLVTSIATRAFSLGVTDANTESSVMPWHLAACDALTTTASTGAGFVYDTDATNDTIQVVAVDDDNDHSCAPFNTGKVPVADTYQTFEVVLEDQGACNMARATFSIDGELVKTLSNVVDRCVLLTPFAAVQNRAACACSVLHVDYIEIEATRV